MSGIREKVVSAFHKMQEIISIWTRQSEKYIWILLVTISMITSSCFLNNRTVYLKSPDSLVQLKVGEVKGTLQYSIFFNGHLLIEPSLLGLKSNLNDLSRLKITGEFQTEINEQWRPLFGKTSLINNHYRQVAIFVKTEDGLLMNIIFRVYNNGVAFRYEVPKQYGVDTLIVLSDRTEFRFPEDYISRSIDRNIESSKFEPGLISQTKFSKLPMLVKTPDCWVALNEASVFDFSMMYLINDSANTTMHADIGISRCLLPLKTPWRVVQIGKKPGDLIESNILPNLNDPCKIEDPAWIKPGKALWDWRNHGDTINGFVYGINEASYRRLIDFASTNLIEYVLFDSDWYSEPGPQFPRRNLDIQEIINYARNKNVNILLYIDRHRKGGNNDWNLDDVLKTFSKWGVAGIKYGFLGSEINDRKTFVDTTRSITRLCAKYQMLVDFHDNPVHPGGEERTWPNRITVEYCHAQQDSRKSFSPTKAVTVPFINGLSGPLDMANGYYDLNGLQYREKVDKTGLNSTIVGETARCLVNYSPLLILPDNGDEYDRKADLFRFIKEMPDKWDETRVLAGEPGEYIVVARRSGHSWFVGANTNEQSRMLNISLDFLGDGEYELIKYLDAEDAHFQFNKEAYKILTETVSKDQYINIPMAAGGGFCMQAIFNTITIE